MPSRPVLLWFLFASALLAGVGRLCIPGHGLSLAGTYEALVHIWCGIVLTLAVLPTTVRVPAVITLGVLTAFEVVMFILFLLR